MGDGHFRPFGPFAIFSISSMSCIVFFILLMNIVRLFDIGNKVLNLEEKPI